MCPKIFSQRLPNNPTLNVGANLHITSIYFMKPIPIVFKASVNLQHHVSMK